MKFALSLFAAVSFSLQVSISCHPVDDILPPLLKKLEEKEKEYVFKYLMQTKEVKEAIEDIKNKLGLQKIDVESCINLAKNLMDLRKELEGIRIDSENFGRNISDLTGKVKECLNETEQEQLHCLQERNNDFQKLLVYGDLKLAMHARSVLKLKDSIPENLKNCKPPPTAEPEPSGSGNYIPAPNFLPGLMDLFKGLGQGLFGVGAAGIGAGLGGLEALAPIIIL